MNLDERLRSATIAAHDSVRGVPVTLQQPDLLITEQPRPLARFPRPPRRATALVIALCVAVAALVAVPVWRAHDGGPVDRNVVPSSKTGRLLHPVLLGGQGSFRIDKYAAIARDESTVFFTHWTDIPAATVLLMRPQWVVDPSTGAYQPVPADLTEWVRTNSRLALGPPTSLRVGSDPAVQFRDTGTTPGQPYTWLCPDPGHTDCFVAPQGGLGLLTVVTHDGQQYLFLGGAQNAQDQPRALARYRQILSTWTWDH